MTPADREEALQRREANAALLMAKLEKDRQELEAEITASAAANKAASAITKALHSDAAKKAKALEAECAQWEAKLARLKSDVSKATPVAPDPGPARAEEEIERDKAAIAAAKSQLAIDCGAHDVEKAIFEKSSAETQARLKTEAHTLAELRSKLATIRGEIEGNVKAREAEVRKKEAAIEAERAKLQEGADALMRAEAQQSEERAKLGAQMASIAAKEVMLDERSRQLQERLKNFVKA